jgi:hypothetical protein
MHPKKTSPHLYVKVFHLSVQIHFLFFSLLLHCLFIIFCFCDTCPFLSARWRQLSPAFNKVLVFPVNVPCLSNRRRLGVQGNNPSLFQPPTDDDQQHRRRRRRSPINAGLRSPPPLPTVKTAAALASRNSTRRRRRQQQRALHSTKYLSSAAAAKAESCCRALACPLPRPHCCCGSLPAGNTHETAAADGNTGGQQRNLLFTGNKGEKRTFTFLKANAFFCCMAAEGGGGGQPVFSKADLRWHLLLFTFRSRQNEMRLETEI